MILLSYTCSHVMDDKIHVCRNEFVNMYMYIVWRIYDVSSLVRHGGGRVATTNLHAHTLARKRHLFIFRFPFTYNIYRLIRFKRTHYAARRSKPSAKATETETTTTRYYNYNCTATCQNEKNKKKNK